MSCKFTGSLLSFASAFVLLGASACTFDPPGSVLDEEGEPAGPGGDPGNPGGDPGTDGTETLTLSFDTEPRGGEFAPANVVAAWVLDANGVFVDTITLYGNVYKNRLVAWNEVKQGADVVTGATRQNHNAPVTATWNIPADLADGTYTVRIETSETNATTPGENAQATFTFEKNGTSSTATPTAPNYLNVLIDYVATPAQ